MADAALLSCRDRTALSTIFDGLEPVSSSLGIAGACFRMMRVQLHVWRLV